MLRFLPLLSLFLLLSACATPMQIEDIPPASGQVAELMEPLPVAPPLPPPPVQTAQADMPVAAPTNIPAKAKSRRPAAAPTPSAKEDEPPVPADLDKQPVEELVIRPDDITGYWMLIAPRIVDVDVGLFSGIHIRYGGEMGDRNVCWLEQKGKSVDAICAAGYVLKSGEGSVDQEGISMRWWLGAATANYAGKFTEPEKILGSFSGGVVGMSITGDVPAGLRKITPPDPQPNPERPSAALIRAVWQDVRQGHLTEGRYEGSAVKRVNQGMPAEIAAETPKSMLYLGRILVRWRKEQRETVQDVYQVSTESGRKLCRVAVNEQGQVLDFGCQPIDGKKN